MSCVCSVVICTHNRYQFLNEAIESIERQTCARARFELIIVDNSTDLVGQRDFMGGIDLSCEHQYVVEGRPGLSRARNIGTQIAKGDFVAFMDDDAQADPRWIDAIIAAFESRENLGIVGGPVEPIWPISRPPWLHKYLEGFLTIVNRGASVRLLADSEWLAGTNMAFRKDALMKVGLFNENLGRMGKLLLSNEEILVSTKIRALGYSVLYDPAIAMSHTVHADRLNHAWMRRRVFWQVVSDLFAEEGMSEMDLTRGVANILDYQQKLSPKDRGIAGLFINTDDPSLFHQQLEALASLGRLMSTNGLDWQGYLTPSTE